MYTCSRPSKTPWQMWQKYFGYAPLKRWWYYTMIYLITEAAALKKSAPAAVCGSWVTASAPWENPGISWWNPKVGIRCIHVCPFLVMIKPPKVDHLCHLNSCSGSNPAISWHCHFVTMTLLRKKRLLKKKRKKAGCVGNQWDLWTMELQFVIILTVNNYWYWYYH